MNEKYGSLIKSIFIGVASTVLASVILYYIGIDGGSNNSNTDNSTQIEKKAQLSSAKRFTERKLYKLIPVRNLNMRGHTIIGSDAKAVAFNIYGRTQYIEEGGSPVTVTETLGNKNLKVIIVTDNHGGDDSVAGTRYRLEFESVDDTRWQIVWLGKQWKCFRGNNIGVWTTELCP